MFDLIKVLDLGKKFAVLDTLLKSKNYCITKGYFWSFLEPPSVPTPHPYVIYTVWSIEIVPRGGPPLKMGGPPLDFINQMGVRL